MKKIFEKVIDMVVRRKLEHMQAELFMQKATSDYIAMMAEIDIPTDEEGDNYVV